MRPPMVAIRLSRRAVAAVVMTDDTLTFLDVRHLRTNRETAREGLLRYVRLLLAQTKAHTAVIDCPMIPGKGTEQLLVALTSLLHEAGVARHHLSTADILAAYGSPAPENRIELRAIAGPLFPEIADVRLAARALVIEAAAAALYAESARALVGDAT